MTVLRSGGDFTPAHVAALDRQLKRYAPFHEHVCLTDMDVTGVTCMPLEHKWPGWWSKMELFAPRVKGDVLFMDLDTVVVAPIDDILRQRKLTMLRDFYRDGKRLKDGLGGGLMFLPEVDRVDPWGYFSSSPKTYMQTYPRGEQFLLEKYYLQHAQRWQDILPGQVVSYKVHCCENVLGGVKFRNVPTDARIVCFHGQPRCWDVPQFKDLY